MKAKILIFTKISSAPLSSGAALSSPGLTGGSTILFAIHEGSLPVVSLVKNEISEIVKKYSLKRHQKFDLHINKNSQQFFLLELSDVSREKLPDEIVFSNNKVTLLWLNFVQAARILKDGKDKNFLQRAVQYISAGGIDESVVAADFDDDFFKNNKKE